MADDNITKAVSDGENNSLNPRPSTILLQSLIPVINKLQDVFNTIGSEMIQLPQIVVIGAQSAGKSSVIEALVGGSFLPRGQGIVTRRPLILQLINCPLEDRKYRSEIDGTQAIEKWGKFLHNDKIFSDFDEIRKEIVDETNRVAGANKGIVTEPINLKIFAPDVVDLTLVDLPGITKVPVGDQPQDIEQQILDIVMKFTKNPNSIILAVTAANTDLATSEALKIAKETDPKGSRTLAVLTKLDLMDQGTDATDVLTGSVIPVKLGIIGVVNRSQQDIHDNKFMEEQLKKESKFLAEKYPTLASKNGTPYLAGTLSRLLMNHINNCLPDLKQRVIRMSSEFANLLKSLGKEVTNTETMLIQIIHQFTKSYIATIEGSKYGESETCGMTKIYQILHESLQVKLSGNEPFKVAVDFDKTISVLSNGSGSRPTLFKDPSFDSPFEEMVKNQISLLETPAIECVDQVVKEMVRNIHDCGSAMKKVFERFPRLQDKIVNVVSKLLLEQAEVTKKDVIGIIEKEKAYINKKHPGFEAEKARNFDDRNENNKKIDYESMFSEKSIRSLSKYDEEGKKNLLVLVRLVDQYVNIVRCSIQDAVPKAVVYFLINALRDQVGEELLQKLNTPAGAEAILNESNHFKSERKRVRDMQKALLSANQIIGEISDGTGGFDDYQF